MSRAAERAWFVVTCVVTVLLVAGIYMWISHVVDERNREEYQQRVDQHWLDIEACDEDGGVLVLSSGGWFEQCRIDNGVAEP